jgi:cytochrome P450/NADPH-cytochrome P450 reductase
VTRRPEKDHLFSAIPGALPSAVKSKQTLDASGNKAANSSTDKESLLILFSSNAGTCKYLAEDLETTAQDRGYHTTVKTMDDATEHLPKDRKVIIITPSYEGRPADNAKKFVTWLEASKENSLKDVNYALFGVGNSEWSSTFHRIPKLLDELLPKLGAERIIESSFVDVRKDLMGPWEDWRDDLLSSFNGESSSSGHDAPELSVTIEKPTVATKLAGEEISEAIVTVNEEIAGTEVGPAKRHMEVELPEGVTYQPGGKVQKKIAANHKLTV